MINNLIQPRKIICCRQINIYSKLFKKLIDVVGARTKRRMRVFERTVRPISSIGLTEYVRLGNQSAGFDRANMSFRWDFADEVTTIYDGSIHDNPALKKQIMNTEFSCRKLHMMKALQNNDSSYHYFLAKTVCPVGCSVCFSTQPRFCDQVQCKFFFQLYQ